MAGGYSFSQVPSAQIPRSRFDRSHGHKTTFDSGLLVPIFVDEALPGDTFDVNASIFARLATPLVPIMDNIHLDVFWFAVPNRLVWDNWQRFCGEQRNPGDSIDFLVPQVDAGAEGFAVGSIFDYFGLPTGIPGLQVSALFSRAYLLIYNEWFRDENLINSETVPTGDALDWATDFSIQRRGKRHDYFTSCLPWPQKGEGVELSLGTSAPVLPLTQDTTPTFSNRLSPTSLSPFTIQAPTNSQAEAVYLSSVGTTNPPESSAVVWRTPGLFADLSASTSVTINSLRQAFQIQKLLERDARGGTRYVELLKSHFGVTSPDFRLQRPEFLGGGSIPLNINPVAQTSPTGTYANTPQGNLAAFGVAGSSRGLGFTKSFVEHSIVMGIICARADLSYQQGTPRLFSRRTRYDYYWPAFAHLGEQAVLNKEIFTQNPSVIDPETSLPMNDSVFGYQERWAEYRYGLSKITGKFRSTDPTPLDFWHLAQEFGSLPTLSRAFIQEEPPIDRVVAVVTEPQFLLDAHFKMRCTRAMPTYSVPGLIDHF